MLKKLTVVFGLTMALAAPFKSANAAEKSALKPISQAALQAMVEKTAKDNLIPGVFVLLNTPQGEFMVSYGTTKLNTSITPQSNTHFRIASNTKTMTAAVIVQQAQEGKLKLSDTVAKYLRNIPNGENITIADLLKMRSGFYNYTDSPIIADNLDKNPKKIWRTSELLEIAFGQPPYFKPDAGFHYTNTNYLLLGLIAEKIDNKPLPDIFQHRLLKPLQMHNTLLPASTYNKLPSPYSHGYQYGSSSYALVDKTYPLKMQTAAKSGKLKPIDYTFQNPSYALAAGGAISTAKDLAIWIKALVSGKLFNAAFHREWLESPVPEDKPDGQLYGYGIAKMKFGPNQIYFHGGEMPGYNSFIGYDPANNVTLIVWTNLDVSMDSQLTANAIMVKVLDQIYVYSPLKK